MYSSSFSPIYWQTPTLAIISNQKCHLSQGGERRKKERDFVLIVYVYLLYYGEAGLIMRIGELLFTPSRR